MRETERAKLTEDGYYIARGFLSEAAIALIRTRIAHALEVTSIEELNYDAARADGVEIPGPEMFRKLSGMVRRYEDVWQAFAVASRGVAINRALLGDNVRQWFNAVFTKPARVGEATPWHQDIGLWTQTDETRWRRPHLRDAASIWVALDPATRANGCLQVVPGSHTGEVIDHVRYPDAVHVELPRALSDDLRGDRVAHVELDPGDAIVWHAHLWHYSPANTSDDNRWAIALVTLRDEDAEQAQIDDLPWLVRGGDPAPFPEQLPTRAGR